MSDKFPHTEFSTLSNRVSRPYDRKEAELRKRAERIRYDVGTGLCDGCDSQITQVDVDLGACTQCSHPITRLDEGDGLIEDDDE